jgi:hypothetical protein
MPCTLYAGKFIFVHAKPLCRYKWETFISPTLPLGVNMDLPNTLLRTALVWVIMQQLLVISYRCFGTTYQSHLESSKIHKVLGFGFLNPEGGKDRLSRNIGKKLPLLTA